MKKVWEGRYQSSLLLHRVAIVADLLLNLAGFSRC